ncbi:sodium:solute symporter, partial [bacterium]|nr:sodium:solute symporter [bacterium]
ALFGGYAAANILKWYWWRFNGFGYFFGMITGIAASLISPIIMSTYFPGVSDLYAFPALLLISGIGCVLGSLLTPAEDDEILKSFYKRVRPWGFWEPIYEKVKQDDPSFQKNTDFWRDVFNILVGMIWQISMVVMPIYIVIREWQSFGISFVVFVITTTILKFNWYDKLEDDAPEAAQA